MHDGSPVSLSAVSSVLEKIGVNLTEDGMMAHVDRDTPAPPDPIAYLSEHGYALVHTYQPDSRYWTFQGIEAGWLVLVSVALLALTFWLVRRRSV